MFKPIETKTIRNAFVCDKCGYIFSPLTDSPKQCHKCKAFFDDKHTYTKVQHERIDRYFK